MMLVAISHTPSTNIIRGSGPGCGPGEVSTAFQKRAIARCSASSWSTTAGPTSVCSISTPASERSKRLLDGVVSTQDTVEARQFQDHRDLFARARDAQVPAGQPRRLQ